jgi:hypothetical protein
VPGIFQEVKGDQPACKAVTGMVLSFTQRKQIIEELEK